MNALNFQIWMSLLTFLTVLFATVYYYRWRQIPNLITVPLIVLGPIMHGMHASGSGFYFSLWGVIVGIGVFMILYLLGGSSGAGDIKLMSGVGALLGAEKVIAVLILTLFIGGAVSTYKLALNSFKNVSNQFRHFLLYKKSVNSLSVNPLNESWLAYAILNYLVQHPLAKDTLEGISKWWILREQVAQSVEKTSKALGYLKSRGFLIEKQYPDQQKYYHINAAKLEKIKSALKEMESELIRRGSL